MLSGAGRVCCRLSSVSGTLHLLQLLPPFPLQEVSALVEQFCICILEITLGRIILFKQALPVLLEVNEREVAAAAWMRRAEALG